ncbi:response regulator [Caulobacter sp. DWR1-3-2b1]|uniref:response regulator n=1 Tax=Caulobacter sp. DWR1-3-2b1 TaxID=2804670 RepID=UPI003CEE47B1
MRLEDGGAEVIGPAPTVQDALTLIQAHGPRLDRAVLDINLRGEKVFPVADALLALDVPFIFRTGYDSDVLPAAYAHVARHSKPLNCTAVLAALAATAA